MIRFDIMPAVWMYACDIIAFLNKWFVFRSEIKYTSIGDELLPLTGSRPPIRLIYTHLSQEHRNLSPRIANILDIRWTWASHPPKLSFDRDRSIVEDVDRSSDCLFTSLEHLDIPDNWFIYETFLCPWFGTLGARCFLKLGGIWVTQKVSSRLLLYPNEARVRIKHSKNIYAHQ